MKAGLCTGLHFLRLRGEQSRYGHRASIDHNSTVVFWLAPIKLVGSWHKKTGIKPVFPLENSVNRLLNC